MRVVLLSAIFALSLGLFYAPVSHAGFAVPPVNNLIVNGDFETGDLTGWEQASSDNFGEWFVYQSGDPVSLPPPPVGNYASASDQFSPDINALYQDIQVPMGGTVCSAIVYYNDDGSAMDPIDNLSTDDSFSNGPSVEQIADRQIYRVDITDPDSDPVEIESGILLPIFENNPQIFELGYTLVEFDLSPFAGQTVRLRALTNAFSGPMNGAIDAVSCERTRTAIPALSEWGLIAMAGLIGLIGLYTLQRKRVRV